MLAADMAMGVAKMSLQKYTAGIAFGHKGAWTCGLSYNHDNLATFDIYKNFKDHDLEVGAEVVYNPRPLYTMQNDKEDGTVYM